MIYLLFLAFLATPLVEIAIFISAGEAFGLGPVLLAVVATAIAGALIVRAQGLGVMAHAREDMREGRPPVASAVHGVFLLAAGALLLTPGFFTDAVGFLFLIPEARVRIGAAILRRLRGHITVIDGSGRPPGA